MEWLQVRIDTSRQGIEPLCTMLSANGMDDVIIEDEADFHLFLQEHRQYWDYVDEKLEASKQGLSRVLFYVPQNQEGHGRLAALRTALQDFKTLHAADGYGPLMMSLTTQQQEDWENNWKRYYRILEVGRRLLIVPAWELERARQRGDYCMKVPVVMDPGLTFGTGSHTTTRMCLEALEEAMEPGGRVLDLGCGSGILSIAALQLGAERATAVDIDEKCLFAATENAFLNSIGPDRCTVLVGDVLTDAALRQDIGTGYDVAVANIVADVIIPLAPTVRHMVRPGGAFLCSGIIDSRTAEAAEALRLGGWNIQQTRQEDGWMLFVCR